MQGKPRAICIEHEEQLNPDGTCPSCRDSNGKAFVLDMQSYYLDFTEQEIAKQKNEAEAEFTAPKYEE